MTFFIGKICDFLYNSYRLSTTTAARNWAKVTTMKSGHININIAKPILFVYRVYGVRVDGARRFFGCSLILCVINAELTVLTAWLTPPRLTIDKYYTSQDSIDFSVVLSLSCLHALRLVRSVSLQAIFIALGFSRCVLSLPLRVSPVLLSEEMSLCVCLRAWLCLFSDGRANGSVLVETHSVL
jgi:hypothetical protein